MSSGVQYMHSHSGLERSLTKDKELSSKAYVLVDEKYKNVFSDVSSVVKKFVYQKTVYYKVPTLVFFRKGGVFKNLEQ